jgi:hypothetical protein
MSTNRASAIQHKVDQLIDLQITTLSQKSSLTSAQLLDYHLRFVRIQTLSKKLDWIKRTNLVIKFANASYGRRPAARNPVMTAEPLEFKRHYVLFHSRHLIRL